MELLFDTANLEQIKTYDRYFPMTGVTTNPSIFKAEGKVAFFEHLKRMRELIGPERTLHVQVTADDAQGMIREAHAIHRMVDNGVYIKVPVTEEGLAAIRALRGEGVPITATAVYSQIQAFMAMQAGANYIAPYFNRMENLDIEPRETIAAMRQFIDEAGSDSRIMAASFRNMAQVTSALLAGAQAVTVQPKLLHDAFGMAAIAKAVEDFKRDWTGVRGDISIADLTE